ncbi:hypothetical protein QAD02_008107 [Eretmocerus hayati]|uniref:Uncharacterized protein n=1 Tax=Eretmocerus hayati TaxID=131215 RepID=A0ACC2N5H4_9HYME|nr:hypothetical protein QAD02_008107 [Eretmocerus hayati]
MESTVKKKENDDLMKYRDEYIINGVPNTYRWKCAQLPNCLHQVGKERFSWDDTGLVSIDDEIIPQSNIVDICNEAMRWRKSQTAVGRQQLANFLRSSDIPREFVGNASLYGEIDSLATPRTSLKRRFRNMSRHFSDSVVTEDSASTSRQQSGDIGDDEGSEVFEETLDKTPENETPKPRKTKSRTSFNLNE